MTLENPPWMSRCMNPIGLERGIFFQPAIVMWSWTRGGIPQIVLLHLFYHPKGVTTVYRKELVECKVATSDKVGEAFRSPLWEDPWNGPVVVFTWWTCLERFHKIDESWEGMASVCPSWIFSYYISHTRWCTEITTVLSRLVFFCVPRIPLQKGILNSGRCPRLNHQWLITNSHLRCFWWCPYSVNTVDGWNPAPPGMFKTL